MKLENRQLVELVGVLAVVISLLFVGLELRQSTIASRAAAYQEIGLATSELWYQLANNRELNDLFLKIVNGTEDDYRNLSDSDRHLLISLTIGSLRQYETIYLQVSQGLLPPEALSSLGYDAFLRSNDLKFMWCDVRQEVGESFAAYIESNGIQGCD